MSSAKFNLMVRVIRKKMAAGDILEDILQEYPKLTAAEKEELRAAVS